MSRANIASLGMTRMAPSTSSVPLRRCDEHKYKQRRTILQSASGQQTQAQAVLAADQVQGMPKFLDSLKYNSDGLVAVIVQHVDTGEVLMQAFADRAALSETMQTRLATFYSRSRKGRWCKGETSGHFIHVKGIFVDCDKDSIIYLSDPIGPSCHTGARTCWFSEASLDTKSEGEGVKEEGHHDHHAHVPMTTLLALERTIQERREVMESKSEAKPSWTSKLMSNPDLLCKKIREEAGELCQTLEENEGKERAASEAADLLYHAMVLLNLQGVPIEDVLKVLRKRFDQSGIDEKAKRPAK
jgi:phosphoribosyl-ATP pyrophosphohydrolase/phosphoribosyl-AMP cyclohydrolase